MPPAEAVRPEVLVHERDDDLYEVAQTADDEDDLVVEVRLPPRVEAHPTDAEELLQQFARASIGCT